MDIRILWKYLNSEKHGQSVNYKHCGSSIGHKGDQRTIYVTGVLNENATVSVTVKSCQSFVWSEQHSSEDKLKAWGAER